MRRGPLNTRLLLKNLLFLLLVPGSVTVWLPLWMTGLKPGPWAATLSSWGWLGWALALAGAALLLWSVFGFMAEGDGTPAPLDPPKALVVWGPYLWVRNPMYLGVLAVVLGEAIGLGEPRLLRYAALLWLFFHLVVTLFEEPTLKRKFGAEYEAFLRRVPRWLPKPPEATSATAEE